MSDPIRSLLVKLGVGEDSAAKLRPGRAKTKLINRLAKRGVPKDVTDAERAVIESLKGTKPEVPAAPAPAAPKGKAKKAEGTSRKGRGGAEAFREAFKSRKSYPRKDLVEHLEGLGVKPVTAMTYIADAKKSAGPFGFQLTEKKTDSGGVLSKV